MTPSALQNALNLIEAARAALGTASEEETSLALVDAHLLEAGRVLWAYAQRNRRPERVEGSAL